MSNGGIGASNFMTFWDLLNLAFSVVIFLLVVCLYGLVIRWTVENQTRRRYRRHATPGHSRGWVTPAGKVEFYSRIEDVPQDRWGKPKGKKEQVH